MRDLVMGDHSKSTHQMQPPRGRMMGRVAQVSGRCQAWQVLTPVGACDTRYALSRRVTRTLLADKERAGVIDTVLDGTVRLGGIGHSAIPFLVIIFALRVGQRMDRRFPFRAEGEE